MEGLNYINNLYAFLNALKLVIPLDQVTFLPSFKGKYIVEKLGIASTDKENEMKLFKVQSSLFLGDKKLFKKVSAEMSKICERIDLEKDVAVFYLP
jgi:hypothetical protein